MKLKKFVGKNSRELLQLVKDELGEDAVVITTRHVRDEIEILATSGDDIAPTETMFSEQARKQPVTTADLVKERSQKWQDETQFRTESQAVPTEQAAAAIKTISAIDHHQERQSNHEEQTKVLGEINNLKSLIASQMAMLTWRDTVHKNPVKAEIWETLKSSGFSPLFARKVVQKLDETLTFEQALEWTTRVLIRNIPSVQKNEDLVSVGGTYALVGPTGVGKTTTTAKLAARCVIKYGNDSVGLITTDSFRIGAQDQLRIYGKILGVQVYTAQTQEDLRSLRQTLQRKRLVLIDTVGMAQRDARIPHQTQMLKDTEVKRIILLNGASQSETLEDVARHYKVGGLEGCILSKLDEAVKLGGVLDIAIRHKLPIHFLATGQQVPEDLYSCNTNVLASRALSAKTYSVFDTNQQEKEWIAALSHRAAHI